jgi:hypothetical protein
MANVPDKSHGRKYGKNPSRPLPVWNGILEHCQQIGAAIWEFLWLIDKITVEDERGIGWCLGKTPIAVARIARDLREHEQTARNNVNRLVENGYVIRKRTPRGYAMGVYNSRKFGAFARKSDREKTINHNRSDREETINHSKSDREKTRGVIDRKLGCDREFSHDLNLLLLQDSTKNHTDQSSSRSRGGPDDDGNSSVVPKPKPRAEPEEWADWYLSQVQDGNQNTRDAIARELQEVCQRVRDNGTTVRNWQKYFDAALAASDKLEPVPDWDREKFARPGIPYLPEPPPFRERKKPEK